MSATYIVCRGLKTKSIARAFIRAKLARLERRKALARLAKILAAA